MERKEHWDDIYERLAPDEVSWYRPHLERSLQLVEQAGLPADAAIIDVGGGSSTLVDDLLDRGYSRVSVLDISSKAIVGAQGRLGPRAGAVTWLTGDITRLELPPRRFDFWHDRAVFHFLRGDEARGRYVAAVRHALRPYRCRHLRSLGAGALQWAGRDAVQRRRTSRPVRGYVQETLQLYGGSRDP
jgi:SAM-dependent methyltransferase